jgi:hypothetical protein
LGFLKVYTFHISGRTQYIGVMEIALNPLIPPTYRPKLEAQKTGDIINSSLYG